MSPCSESLPQLLGHRASSSLLPDFSPVSCFSPYPLSSTILCSVACSLPCDLPPYVQGPAAIDMRIKGTRYSWAFGVPWRPLHGFSPLWLPMSCVSAVSPKAEVTAHGILGTYCVSATTVPWPEDRSSCSSSDGVPESCLACTPLPLFSLGLCRDRHDVWLTKAGGRGSPRCLGRLEGVRQITCSLIRAY